MTSAQLVNRIIDKLRTGRVTFVSIQEIEHNRREVRASCEIVYCHHNYVINGSDLKIHVHEPVGEELDCTSHSDWIEGVLNGKVRNDAGELVEA